MKKALFILLVGLSSHTYSAWNIDENGLYHSNFCRAGYYWQIVSWNFTGTACYMPMHGLWGKRVVE
ncbi:hypothetical protein HXZ93_11480 [Acinetobacter pseudolwoffii]|uniref:hypothetical protein n=1 Tax=Acinetobacter TaxID=469 RepID=UPI00135B8021|nr:MULTISPECIES: hypothetical protein [Acinetobacter]MDM1336633.1 hypothetical protein [Acinetobacter pseudolwoffii]